MDRNAFARLLAGAVTCAPALAAAQAAAIVVTPLDADEVSMAQPASVLRAEALRRKQGASLGETLGGEPGVHAGGMGPNASRPVIRGQDGPRVRVLDNGLGTMDVSTLSPDHAPAVETFGATQVEVLRGPATLLYGGGAIGGLVNVVTKRIPRERMEGFAGAAEVRAGGAAREGNALVDLNGGAGGVAWHMDASARKSDDYRIRGRQNPTDATSPVGVVPNSAASTQSVNAGLSLVGERGYLGVGVSGLDSFYGVPGGERARIDLERQRLEVAGELRDPLPGFSRARLLLGSVRYRHAEIEQSGAVATRFRNDANEFRLELRHTPLGGLNGAIGVSGQRRDFSAVGAESFLVPTRGAGAALFAIEELTLGRLRLEAGLRLEHEQARPDGASGRPERRFGPRTASVGASWNGLPAHTLAFTLTRAQRAPGIEELYANGPHAAAGAVERGNAALGLETSRNVDLSLARTEGAWRWKAGAYANRIHNYIFSQRQDVNGNGVFEAALDRVDSSGTADPAGAFFLLNTRQAGARFHGFEAELSWRQAEGPWRLRAFADAARGRLEGAGNVARMAPARTGLEAGWSQGAWSAHGTLLRVARQDRIAIDQETATPASLRLDAGLSYRLRHGAGNETTVFVQGRNLLDRDLRVHTSFLRDSAPLPGRSLFAGLRSTF
ncbi:MAG TPA: TonB-dependent receptor [Burkholderiales bacterium]